MLETSTVSAHVASPFFYRELVDSLMPRYLVGHKELAPPVRPQIAAPVVPELP
jgi:hypothetical protein